MLHNECVHNNGSGIEDVVSDSGSCGIEDVVSGSCGSHFQKFKKAKEMRSDSLR